MEIESSENIASTCADLASKTGPVVKGAFVCSGKQLSSASGTGSEGASRASNQSNSGLSTGAKAGIGVGIALGILLLAVVVVFVIRRRRRSKAALIEISPEKADNGRDMTQEKGDPVEKDANAKWSNEPWRAELEGSEGTKYELEHPPAQLPAQSDEPAELSEQHGASELDRKT